MHMCTTLRINQEVTVKTYNTTQHMFSSLHTLLTSEQASVGLRSNFTDGQWANVHRRVL